MRSPAYAKRFKRDFKKAEARGKDIQKLEEAMFLLVSGAPLPDRYHDHPMKGKWEGYRDLHIESDWVLIYKILDDIVFFTRTGTHSDLLKM